VPLSLIGEGFGAHKKENSSQKGADQQIWSAPSIYGKYSKATSYKFDTHVSGGA
jgi:hypothetical protein